MGYVWAAVVAGIGLGSSLVMRLTAAPATSAVAARAATQTASGPGAATVEASVAPLGTGVPIQANDLKAVDPTALLQQAAAEVRKRASNCELTYAYFGEELAGGVLDATGYTALLEWGCHSVDKSKPPGQDVADDEWSVRVSSGTLDIKKTSSASHNKPPWVEPTCPFSDAWAAVVASGVPANARVRVYYRYYASSRRMLWDLDVKGHPELSRKVDGATCQVARER